MAIIDLLNILIVNLTRRFSDINIFQAMIISFLIMRQEIRANSRGAMYLGFRKFIDYLPEKQCWPFVQIGLYLSEEKNCYLI